ncbi:MAG: FtsQ-type POTRA domain-containing protein [Deltaproteobacteria bacterium]|nr:FtsQ-type POTRA domain-containing protein [Deltaproteobacteria bacterium]
MFRKKAKNYRKKVPLKARIRGAIHSRWLRGISVVSLFGALFILGGLLYHQLLNAPYLEIKEITINGVKRVSREDVLELMGTRPGDNILAIDIRGVGNRIKTNPWVEDVRVGRNLPDRLSVEVKERNPVAFLNLDALYLLDNKGNAFKRAALEDELDMPVISGLNGMTGVEEGRELLLEAIELIHLLSGRHPFGLGDVSEIRVDRLYGLSIYTITDGVKIEFGRGSLPKKLERLDRVLIEVGGLAGFLRISLNYDKGVIVRFRPQTPDSRVQSPVCCL